MGFSATIAGRRLSFRMPTVDELSVQRKAASDDARRLKALRRLVVDCCDDDGAVNEVLAEKPGAYVALGEALLRACGAAGPLEEVAEDDVSDEAAQAIVRCADHGRLFALRYAQPAIGVELELVVRAFGDREIQEYQRSSDSVAACRALIKRVLKHGTVEDIESRAPGLFIALCEYLTEQTGALMRVELGEA